MSTLESRIFLSLRDAVSAPPPKVSFEFFPPKNTDMEKRLWQNILKLEKLNPVFVSITYGAAGSTRTRTHDIVYRIKNETSLEPAAHLTCVGASREEINLIAEKYWQNDITHIVALRGDAPEGSQQYTPHPDGYRYACDLVAGLKNIADFDISVACYPEKHPEAPSLAMDLEYLRMKVDAGANRAISQMFFDAERFLRFRDLAADSGITIPIIPGILPIGNFWQVKKFATNCGASVPKWLDILFSGLENDTRTHEMLSAAVAAEMCQLLRNNGVEQFHFYTLNRAGLTLALCRMLGITGK